MRYSDEKAVCTSVKHVNCDKTEERSVEILYHTKDHLAWFSEKNGWWGRPLPPEIFGQLAPLEQNLRF